MGEIVDPARLVQFLEGQAAHAAHMVEFHKEFGDEDGYAFYWQRDADTYAAVIAHIAALQAKLEAAERRIEDLQGMKFSDRQYHAMRSRLDRAERSLQELSGAFLPVMEAMRPLVLNLERLRDAALSHEKEEGNG